MVGRVVSSSSFRRVIDVGWAERTLTSFPSTDRVDSRNSLYEMYSVYGSICSKTGIADYAEDAGASESHMTLDIGRNVRRRTAK